MRAAEVLGWASAAGRRVRGYGLQQNTQVGRTSIRPETLCTHVDDGPVTALVGADRGQSPSTARDDVVQERWPADRRAPVRPPVLESDLITSIPMGSAPPLNSRRPASSTDAPNRAGGRRADRDQHAAGGRRAVRDQHARPFLKWAGGKRQLLPALREYYPEDFGDYYEPFLGSGAVFFDLAGAGRLDSREVHLTDVNADLIGCWLQLLDNRETVIQLLRELQAGYDADSRDHYYRVRAEFNPLREAIMNGRGPQAEKYTARLAAMFIYLNRTGYNGLFRLNSSGHFNVPRGDYRSPKICDEANLLRVASTLSRLSARIEHASFEVAVSLAKAGDFVYFDPPYAPMSTTARFTSYTADGFGNEEQQRLQRVILELADRQCHVVLSNSTAPQITALYRDNSEARKLNIKAHTVPARRAINSKASRRGHVDEYIITNVRKQPT